jgi:hydrogenase maturation factor HypF (carbamoyltransferase family)
MTTTTLVIVAIVVAVAALAVAWMYSARRRREQLRSRFGPEYQQAVKDLGSEQKAEAVLAEREKRVLAYHVRDLSSEERARFTEAWRKVQARFVDDPAGAVTEADLLVTEVMTVRGYPMSDFDRRAEDLTFDHPTVVHHYRHARDIAVRHSRKSASTEDLRQALVHYRALFADLLEVPQHPARRSA